MAYANPWNLISTVLLVTGALVFGEALHQSVVTGEVSLFSQPVLLALGLGTVLMAVGYRVRIPADELTRETASTPSESTEDDPAGDQPVDAPGDAEYDPRLSPLGNTPSDARERSVGDERSADADGAYATDTTSTDDAATDTRSGSGEGSSPRTDTDRNAE
ncbi:hypothetical protein AUR64_09965 [Haloprofundus marisrubri]|uniref:Uncharacterized protein n=1 Tax=Haloprofundus marisrubri TaxID=1514971 RepID=A0A0W1RA33_9EURY|nr:hypothetical protein [Haloprofundus marisrubri]KTG09938.1 hypothetical protein AUR64_09965 [Haloprofundus marisrubri]